MKVTFITGKSGATMRLEEVTLADLRERIQRASGPDKFANGWLKLATFGEKRSPKGSLRTNENVLKITGIEVDYDEGEISLDDAVATIGAARLKAPLDTPASHQPD